jgi:hypothetical protein
MSHFFIDNFAQPDGNHEVHLVGCTRMPADKRYVGNYYSVAEALIEARKEFWQSSGCDRCAREQPHASSVGRISAGAIPSLGRLR